MKYILKKSFELFIILFWNRGYPYREQTQIKYPNKRNVIQFKEYIFS